MTITDLTTRMTAIERRLLAVEESIHTLDRRFAELDALQKVVADLKFEVEDMQEA